MNNHHPSYFDQMRDADEALDDALAAVRAEQDAGRITELEAAAERIQLLERHIAECQRLRAALGEGSGE
jgi:hypothetical protein